MSVEEIPNSAALRLQLACIIGHEPSTSYIEVRPLRLDGLVAKEREFVPVGAAFQRVPEMVHQLAPTMHVYVGVCPRIRREGTAQAVRRAWCLWVDLDSQKALGKLAPFKPQPSIVICSGSGGAHCYWPLKSPLDPATAQRYNRRLVLALNGDPAATDPARILRPAGSLNHKHEPAREVTCRGLELDVFEAVDVVGQLPDSQHYTPRRPPSPRVRDAAPDRILDGLVRTVREARPPVPGVPGERNEKLFWAVNRILEHADNGKLDEHHALEEIRAAGLQVGLDAQTVDATIRSGLRLRQRGAA